MKTLYNDDKNTVTNYWNKWKSSYKILSIDFISFDYKYQNIKDFKDYDNIKIINIKNQETRENISFSVKDLESYTIKNKEIIIALQNKKIKISY